MISMINCVKELFNQPLSCRKNVENHVKILGYGRKLYCILRVEGHHRPEGCRGWLVNMGGGVNTLLH